MSEQQNLRRRALEAFLTFKFTDRQWEEVWEAFQAEPDSCERLALRAMSGQNPVALFLSELRAGAHLEPEHVPVRYTGWRFVRGSHGGSYVRDPRGLDRLPAGYDFGTHPPRGTRET
jgi:hypothetical protein